MLSLCSATIRLAKRLLQQAGRPFDRSAKSIAHAQETSGDGALHGFRSAEIRQTGRDRARCHAVLDKRDGQGVEDYRLLVGWKPTLQLEERHVPEGNLADQLFGQVVAADDDPIRGAPAEVGAELFPCHGRLTVSLVL